MDIRIEIKTLNYIEFKTLKIEEYYYFNTEGKHVIGKGSLFDNAGIKKDDTSK